MNTIPNPDNWMDVFTILAAVLLAAIPSWFAARNHRSLSEVKNQVKNAHSTNLRDDIDRAISGVEALSVDVRGLRQDLVMEEERRRKQILELRDEIDRRPIPLIPHRRQAPQEVE
jgi:hypothetical protein